MDRIKQLYDTDGFIEAYYEAWRSGMKCSDAFDSVNNEFKQLFGKPKYTDYKSFQVSRDRRLKGNKG